MISTAATRTTKNLTTPAAAITTKEATTTSSTIMMGGTSAIQLNNDAVSDLANGKVVQAYEKLSAAAKAIQKQSRKQESSRAMYSSCGCPACCYQWGASSNTVKHNSSKANNLESKLSFLFIQPLNIILTNRNDGQDDIIESSTYPKSKQHDHECACSYSWTVHYNLALASTILGFGLGEKGHSLLRQALKLYGMVERRVKQEDVFHSQYWSTLLLAVLNNQAFIFQEFAMEPERNTCLEALAFILCTLPVPNYPVDHQNFVNNTKILIAGSCLASAA